MKMESRRKMLKTFETNFAKSLLLFFLNYFSIKDIL